VGKVLDEVQPQWREVGARDQSSKQSIMDLHLHQGGEGGGKQVSVGERGVCLLVRGVRGVCLLVRGVGWVSVGERGVCFLLRGVGWVSASERRLISNIVFDCKRTCSLVHPPTRHTHHPHCLQRHIATLQLMVHSLQGCLDVEDDPTPHIAMVRELRHT
jgi:hypothetical protein